MRWVIGDIHGMFHPLETLLEAVAKLDTSPRFIFVGDYVNRGPDARKVLELLLSLTTAKFVRGNHDDIFDLVLHGQSYADNATEGNRLAAFSWFMNYGLDHTLVSYGADLAELHHLARHPSVTRLEQLVTVVPDDHRTFVRNLPGLVEYDDVFVVHAKWSIHDPSELPSLAVRLATHAALRHKVIWGRYTLQEIVAPKQWMRTGFFGHTPVTHYLPTADPHAIQPDSVVPLTGPNIVLVDTAAALSARGRLTAYCVETHQFVQADHFGKLVKAG